MRNQIQNSVEHIIFLGEAGFPFGLASIQRMTLMAKALIHVGLLPTVICRKGVWEYDKQINFKKQGNFEGIDYKYTSKSVFRPKGFFVRNLHKLNGMYGEFALLKQLKRNGEIDLAIVSNMSVIHLLRYRIYSAILNFPIVLNFVEMASSMQHRTGFITQINDLILDKWVIKLFDGALPISDNLMNYYKVISPAKPRMKVPILCDYEKFKGQRSKKEPYFLYCGSLSYIQVIEFIINAYKNLSEKKGTKLYLIVSGASKNGLVDLQKKINRQFETEQVKLFSDIPYEQLVQLYNNALALLIPLRSTLQDSYRFPHKIGEYLASGNPIITTDVGEIRNYFEDGKTAIIADTFSVNLLTKKMEYVVNHPKTIKKIGLNGRELGLKEFDYRAHGRRLMEFLQKIKDDKLNL